ncbi:MAG: lysozyme family protein [Blautia sp.]
MTTTDKKEKKTTHQSKAAHAYTGRTETTASFSYRTFRCRDFYRISPVFAPFGPHLLSGSGKGRAVDLSDSVLQYQEQVLQYCEEYSIPAFSQIVLAIMQQESAGSVPDVMQASESPFNTWYANTPNSIPDPDYSIRVGVETFAYCLEEAGCAAPNQKERLKLALQTYNYGNSYASWALTNYGGYSPDNALEFSENMKVKLGWNQYGDPEYVSHVLRYYRS